MAEQQLPPPGGLRERGTAGNVHSGETDAEDRTERERDRRADAAVSGGAAT